MPRRVPRRTAHSLDLNRGRGQEMRGQAAERRRAGGRRDRRGGAELSRRVRRARWGETIRNAVQLALGGFLSLASRGRTEDLRTPTRSGGRGLLPARPRRGPQRPHHRRPALGVPHRRPGLLAGDVHDGRAQRPRPPRCWRTSPSSSSPTSTSCPRPRSPGTPTRPRPPAGCASGCWSGRPRCSWPVHPPRRLVEAAERAGWTPPTTLTAVLVPESQVRPVLGRRRRRAPSQARRGAGACRRGTSCSWSPTPMARRRAALLRTLRDRGSIAGPPVPWLEARALVSTARSAPTALGIELDTEAHLPRLVLHADESALGRPARPGARAVGGPAARRPRRSSPTPCAPGCSTRAVATTSPPRCSCTRRPSATAWASSATSTATGSRTRTRSWSSPSPSPERVRTGPDGCAVRLCSGLRRAVRSCRPLRAPTQPTCCHRRCCWSRAAAPADVVRRRQAYVALGDSYTSGAGRAGHGRRGLLPLRRQLPGRWSPTSWDVTLTDVSCGGATTTSLVGVQETSTGPVPPQFEALTPGDRAGHPRDRRQRRGSLRLVLGPACARDQAGSGRRSAAGDHSARAARTRRSDDDRARSRTG